MQVKSLSSERGAQLNENIEVALLGTFLQLDLLDYFLQ